MVIVQVVKFPQKMVLNAKNALKAIILQKMAKHVRDALRTKFFLRTDTLVYVVKILKHQRMGNAEVSGKLNLNVLLPY